MSSLSELFTFKQITLIPSLLQQQHSNLTTLSLTGRTITDSTILNLVAPRLPRLRNIKLSQTMVTAKGFMQFAWTLGGGAERGGEEKGDFGLERIVLDGVWGDTASCKFICVALVRFVF